MPHGDATVTRLPILWRVVLPAILGAIGLFYSSQAPAGSGGFYAAVFFTAAIIGIGLIALFIVGALMVRLVPFLAALINDLLDICNKLPNGVFGGNQIY